MESLGSAGCATSAAVAAMHGVRANDYAVGESDLRRSLVLNTTDRQFRAEGAFSWALSLVIGVLNGIAGFLFNQGIYLLNRAKFQTTLRFISPGGGFGVPYGVYLAFTVLYALAAGVLGSYVSPQAAGSGIPEIRCYLNGIHVKGLLTVRTFFAKAFGVLFSIAAGLVVGKEGPFTHVGAILGGGVAHLGSTTLTRATNGHWRAVLRTRFGSFFRNPISHRDYVAAGAAAGVSSAFAAPIGGILFSVEQGSSFYNFNMLCHAFLAAGVALWVTLLLTTAVWEGADLYRTQIIAQQQFAVLSPIPGLEKFYYYLWEIPIFACMGVGGGLLGAGMIKINEAITRQRRLHIPPTAPARRVAEVVFLAALTATAWLLASFLSPCEPTPTLTYEPKTAMNQLYGGMYPQLWCPDGSYSSFGALFFRPQMVAIGLLFENPISNERPVLFAPAAMATLAGLGWLFMSATFGVGAATGLFVPSLLIGSSSGRLVGRAVRAVAMWAATVGGATAPSVTISLNSYAVVGAGAVLGGVSRMLLCNTVLVLETAGAMSLTVPLLATTFVAKLVADLLAPVGIFDLAIQRAGYPYLPSEPTDLADIKLQHALQAGDVMSRDLATLPPRLTLGELVDALRKYPHYSNFPLVEPAPQTDQPQLQPQLQPQAPTTLPRETPLGPDRAGPGVVSASGAPMPSTAADAPAGQLRRRLTPGANGAVSARGGGGLAPPLPPLPPRPSQSGAGPSTHGPGSAAYAAPEPSTATAAAAAASASAAATAAAAGNGAGDDGGSSSSSDDPGPEWTATSTKGGANAPTAAPPPPPPQPPPSAFTASNAPSLCGRLTMLSAFAAVPPVALPSPSAHPAAATSAAAALAAAAGAGAAPSLSAAPSGASAPHRLSLAGGAAGGTDLRRSLAAVRAPAGPELAPTYTGAFGTSTPAQSSQPAPGQAAPLGGLQQQQAHQEQQPTGGVIVGAISRCILLKLIEMRIEMSLAAAPSMQTTSAASTTGSIGGTPPRPPRWWSLPRLWPRSRAGAGGAEAAARRSGPGAAGDSSEPTAWLGMRRAAMSRRKAARLLDAVDAYPAKPPASRAGEEKLFARLSEAERGAWIDLSHYMQRVPYIVPATASLARTYKLFRGLGLHHVYVTPPSIPIIGLITRPDLTQANAYRVAYRLAQQEQTANHDRGPSPPPQPPPSSAAQPLQPSYQLVTSPLGSAAGRAASGGAGAALRVGGGVSRLRSVRTRRWRAVRGLFRDESGLGPSEPGSRAGGSAAGAGVWGQGPAEVGVEVEPSQPLSSSADGRLPEPGPGATAAVGTPAATPAAPTLRILSAATGLTTSIQPPSAGAGTEFPSEGGAGHEAADGEEDEMEPVGELLQGNSAPSSREWGRDRATAASAPEAAGPAPPPHSGSYLRRRRAPATASGGAGPSPSAAATVAPHLFSRLVYGTSHGEMGHVARRSSAGFGGTVTAPTRTPAPGSPMGRSSAAVTGTGYSRPTSPTPLAGGSGGGSVMSPRPTSGPGPGPGPGPRQPGGGVLAALEATMAAVVGDTLGLGPGGAAAPAAAARHEVELATGSMAPTGGSGSMADIEAPPPPLPDPVAPELRALAAAEAAAAVGPGGGQGQGQERVSPTGPLWGDDRRSAAAPGEAAGGLLAPAPRRSWGHSLLGVAAWTDEPAPPELWPPDPAAAPAGVERAATPPLEHMGLAVAPEDLLFATLLPPPPPAPSPAPPTPLRGTSPVPAERGGDGAVGLGTSEPGHVAAGPAEAGQ
ncbi:hypothetical protein HYH03_001414 [Edaphochlamys debaryana]|uniref:Chloride channel protein n=1 Tax=Edaphochlamys debaryana TaxID=47281 RepID=A0A835YF98_9CHLO|nr:hypothetical protein HYH03_001414 [Edaphochlamys debaryana]|eukprot:KAG2500647.1 hypothetical protein HYH03_001414 [Edaphochlamys debaryana]